MDIDQPLTLLGGLSARRFMRAHWQKRPLLIRAALPDVEAPLTRAQLFAIAAQEGVQSRLVTRNAGGQWTLRVGPIARRALPALNRRRWTLLVQGLDLHVAAARELLEHFRFVPDARLDDLMLSYATDGGGVGPHVDSYDVFLLQVHGTRRWRVGRCVDPTLRADAPLKILARFVPEHEWLLAPGDMLYLPPGWAHDGVARGECMTCSIGYRAPSRDELARELLLRVADAIAAGGALYRDPAQPAVEAPGRVPPALYAFARRAVEHALARTAVIERALGEALSEPKPEVWFRAGEHLRPGEGVRLDARSRMIYDDNRVYVNGESFRIGGRAGALVRRLADTRVLDAAQVATLGPGAKELLDQWAASGWLRGEPGKGTKP